MEEKEKERRGGLSLNFAADEIILCESDVVSASEERLLESRAQVSKNLRVAKDGRHSTAKSSQFNFSCRLSVPSGSQLRSRQPV